MGHAAATEPVSHSKIDASVHAWLRTFTAEAHARAEQAVMRALAPLGYERYGDYLERVLALYEPLEQALWSSAALRIVLPDADLRRKVPWLREDLAALGREHRAFAAPPELPSLETPLEQLGAAYVVEGATLGGRVLLARLRASGVLHGSRRGARFLSGYGSQGAALWHAFRSALNGAACCQADWTRIGVGAVGTFRAYEAAIAAGAR